MVNRAIRLLVVGWLVAGTFARAELTHRYTFNDGTADDSVGSAHGTFLGNAFADLDGLLQLPGGGGDYVSLDAPAIGINNYTDATFEAWFTANNLLNWQRVFDFGDRTVPVNQQGYIYYTPQSGGGTGLGVYATFGNRSEAAHAPLVADQFYHLAVVIDDDANGDTGLFDVYINGDMQASVGHTRSLSDVGSTFALLGESLVTNDPNFNGTLDEFRIYNHALEESEIDASISAGPTPVATLLLVVDTVTGDVTISGEIGAPVSFDYYTITSPQGALDPDGWWSLDEQNRDAIGAGEGQSWDVTGTPTTTQLAEAFLLGSSTGDGGENMIELGTAFDTDVFGPGTDGDLVFQYSRPLSSVLQTGTVVYVTSDPLFGDYNEDGVVNAADYVVWRNHEGTMFDLPNRDPEAVGDIGPGDYQFWVDHFGNMAGAGASAASSQVPEPAGIMLLGMAIFAFLGNRSRRLLRFQATL